MSGSSDVSFASCTITWTGILCQSVKKPTCSIRRDSQLPQKSYEAPQFRFGNSRSSQVAFNGS